MNTFVGWSGVQWLCASTAIMALLVMVDAFIGHYRSGFVLRVQYAPLAACLVIAVAGALATLLPGRMWPGWFLLGAGLLGVAAGIVGVGFHYRHVFMGLPAGRGWLLHRVMYHAPLLAPLALAAVGALGALAAAEIVGYHRPLGVPARQLVLLLVAFALAGAAVQAAVLHYRGAFNNPLMYAPATAPLFAVLGVAWFLSAPGRAAEVTLSVLLWATFLVGFVGLGMHLRGFDRMMGGLRLPRMNVPDGPAAAAPALFAGFAGAGLTALHLM